MKLYFWCIFFNLCICFGVSVYSSSGYSTVDKSSQLFSITTVSEDEPFPIPIPGIGKLAVSGEGYIWSGKKAVSVQKYLLLKADDEPFAIPIPGIGIRRANV